jgi:hypothetical protein
MASTYACACGSVSWVVEHLYRPVVDTEMSLSELRASETDFLRVLVGPSERLVGVICLVVGNHLVDRGRPDDFMPVTICWAVS